MLWLLTAPLASVCGEGAIHDAVAANNPTAVRAALADGADVNEIGAGGEPPLMEAARSDKLRAGAALMKMGADSTIRGASDGLTALHIAAHRGHGKFVTMMLRYDVDWSDMGPDGLTPFHRACMGADGGHTDAVFAFLDAGVPPDVPSKAGKQPIDMAGNENTRKLLQEALHERRRRGR